MDRSVTIPEQVAWTYFFRILRSFRRYEVELQLGPTDETHIIRTIEYWDIERKRYPQYDHCAVIIAEDITARFFNVISLFNGAIPLIAIQMRALKVDGKLTIVFTKVVDELTRGLVDEDEEALSAPADRTCWDERASKATMQMADDLFLLAKGCDPSLEMEVQQALYRLVARWGRLQFC